MKKRVSSLGVLSKRARAIRVGPSVMSRKSNDGGYFVVFKKDKTVMSAFGCAAIWRALSRT
jgi:hypothetical protein